MPIIGADGKPIQKNWSQMDSEERMDVLRHGLGHIIAVVEKIDRNLVKVVEAMDSYENTLGSDGQTTFTDTEPLKPEGGVQIVPIPEKPIE